MPTASMEIEPYIHFRFSEHVWRFARRTHVSGIFSLLNPHHIIYVLCCHNTSLPFMPLCSTTNRVYITLWSDDTDPFRRRRRYRSKNIFFPESNLMYAPHTQIYLYILRVLKMCE